MFRNETEEWIHITINGKEIVCTPSHPFYSPVKGWTNAVNLRAGDILVTLNGEYVVVEQVQHELLECPETTYNFEVEGFHTYYVSDTQVLVHNKCSVNQMNRQIQKGQAPSGITRIDPATPNVPNSQIHAHFSDKTSINIDGSTHDAINGLPKLSKAIREWLQENGWKI